MKYPKLKCEDKQNTVVCSLTSKKMKEMRKEKHTYQEIADKFKVTIVTVKNHLLPIRNTLEWKEKTRKRVNKYNKQRYENDDSEVRRKNIDSVKKYYKKRYKNDPKFREWRSQTYTAWVKENQKKHPTWSATCTTGSHETTNHISRCKNSLGKCKCPCHKK